MLKGFIYIVYINWRTNSVSKVKNVIFKPYNLDKGSALIISTDPVLTAHLKEKFSKSTSIESPKTSPEISEEQKKRNERMEALLQEEGKQLNKSREEIKKVKILPNAMDVEEALKKVKEQNKKYYEDIGRVGAHNHQYPPIEKDKKNRTYQNDDKYSNFIDEEINDAYQDRDWHHKYPDS